MLEEGVGKGGGVGGRRRERRGRVEGRCREGGGLEEGVGQGGLLGEGVG